MDSGGRVRTAVSHTHTHTGLKVVLTDFEAFRSEHSKQTKKTRNQHALRIQPVFSKFKSEAYRRSYSEKRKISPTPLYFEFFHGTVRADRRTHGHENHLNFSPRSTL